MTARPRRLTSAFVILAVAGLLGAAAYLSLSGARPTPIRIAFATSLTGASQSGGLDSLAATKLYLDEVNDKGGIDGRPVELVLFDDASSEETAKANVDRIAASPSVAVLGHLLSTTSLAAGTGYKFVGIPALTGTSFADDLTFANDYYFRAQTTSSVQGRSIAEYLRAILKAPAVQLVYSRDRFGRSFVRGFAQGYERQQVDAFAIESDRALRAESISAMVETLAGQPEPGYIVVGADSDTISETIKALRRRGIRAPVITSGTAGSEAFLQTFANEPEEKQQPGFFSDKLYASPPVIFDSAGPAAQGFANAFARATGHAPGWMAAGAYDAARVMVEALRRARVQNRPETKEADREAVRLQLGKIDSPQTAVAGLTGPLYFDANRDMPRPVRMGLFRFGSFVTAPLQLVQVEHPDLVNLAEEEARGAIVSFAGRHYWRQRAVYTGIDINRLSRIDIRQGSFTADFYLWMRFAGSDDAPTRIEFPALLDKGGFDPSKPIKAGQEDGLNYRLFRVSSDFKTTYDLHDYPFDRQRLLIRFQNTEQRQEQVTYVIDGFGMRLTAEKDAVNADGAYSGLQLWKFLGLRYFVDAFASSSTLGQSSMFAASARTEYPGFNATITLQREYTIFIIKTMLPLFLLVLVVFTTLFFPETLFRERVGLPVTAILTGAVLLVSVNGQLGDVGYTVALEKIFYAFFGLCLMALVAGFGHEMFRYHGRPQAALVLDRISQVVYVVTVIGISVLFYLLYGEH